MPLQSLQYIPCLSLIVAEQFFPRHDVCAVTVAEEETEDDDEDDEPPPGAPPGVPLTCPRPLYFAHPL